MPPRLEGLPANNCNSITQDKYGFIWVGTTSGLIRYDASSFLTINTTSKPALKDNNIKSILALKDSLWIASTTAVEILNLKTFSVTSFSVSLPPNDYIIRLHHQDENNSVWLASDFGYLYQWNAGRLTLVQAPPPTHDWLKTPHNSVIAMGSNQFGFWWSRLDGNLFLVEGNKPKLLFRADTLKSKGLSVLKSDGTVWSASNGYFLGRDNQGKQIEFERKGEQGFLLNSRAISYVEDDQHTLWLGSVSGSVMKIDRGNKPSGFSTVVQSLGSAINELVVDAQGLLWIASSNGLYQVQTKQSIGKTILTSDTDTKISTRKILQDEKGAIYIATYSGLFQMSSDLNESPKKIELKKLNGNTITIYDMVNDSRGFLWIAAEGDGLLLFNKKTQEITSLNKLNHNGFAQRYFISLLRDTKGLFWIGGYEGLITFDSDSRQFSVFKNDRGDSLFYNQKVFDVEESKDGTIWVGSEKGLYKVIPETQVATKIELGNQLPESIPLRSLFFDSKGLLWLGTKGAGLIAIDFITNKTSVFTVAEGLSNNTVNEILEDPKKNALWITTDNGLSRMTFADHRFQNFSKANGLSANELNHKSAALTRENKFLFGGVDGVSVLDPYAVNDDSITTPLQLVSSSKYDAARDTMIATPTHGSVLPFHLEHDDRMFSVQFRLLNFETPAENKYAYRIEGLMNTWAYLGTQNSLLLNSLEAGDYTLLIKGAGRDGRWSSSILKIPIHVKQAFYKTWWFIVSCLLMLVGIGYFAHLYRMRQVLRIERVRTRIARDLHDELGSSLTSIGIYSDLAREQANGDHKHVEQIASLSREASATLRDIVWAIDSKDDTLESLLLRLRDLMHQMLEIKGIHCELSKFNLNEKRILPAFVKQNVYLIFKEGINNIARHTEATHVELKIEMDVESLRMELVNDGILIDKKDLSQGGNGLRNMQSRADTMGGNLSITKEKNFSICLNLPLNVLHLN